MTDSQRKPGRQRSVSPARSVVIIGCAVFVMYCSGKTSSESGGAGAAAGSAGLAGSAGASGQGYGGHTAICSSSCGAPCPPCASGGAGAGAASGTAAGGAGSGGVSGFGYAGHTSACGATPCNGGYGGFGGAGAGGVDAGGEAGAGEAGALPFSLPASLARACYTTVAYEPGACLAADDALLAWLSGVPQGCAAHITAGPFATSLREQQSCCYDVACRAP